MSEEKFLDESVEIDFTPKVIKRALGLGEDFQDEVIKETIEILRVQGQDILLLLHVTTACERENKPLLINWSKKIGIEGFPPGSFTRIKIGLRYIFIYSGDKLALRNRIRSLEGSIDAAKKKYGIKNNEQ